MKAVVAAFNQEKALVGAFSVITNLRMELYELLGSEVWLGVGVVAGVVAMVLLLVLAVLAVTRTRKRRQGSPGPASTATSNTEQVQSWPKYHRVNLPSVEDIMMWRHFIWIK